MAEVRSSLFRKHYYQTLESTISEIDEKVEILHGERLRNLQSHSLSALHRCLAKNEAADAHENRKCQEKFEKSELNSIQAKLENEKLRLKVCAQGAFQRFVGKEELGWEESKKEIEGCLGEFRQSVFMKCFAGDKEMKAESK